MRFENITVHNPQRDCSADKAFYDDASLCLEAEQQTEFPYQACLTLYIQYIELTINRKQIINDKQTLKNSNKVKFMCLKNALRIILFAT